MLLANAKRLNAIDWHEPSRPGTGSRPQPHRTLDMKREVLRDREQTALRAGRAYDEWGRLIIARPDNPGGTERGPPPLHEQVAIAASATERAERAEADLAALLGQGAGGTTGQSQQAEADERGERASVIGARQMSNGGTRDLYNF